MTHYYLEAPPGTDIDEAIMAFARNGAHTSVTVLSASGMVHNVIFERGLGSSLGATIGPHRLVSFSGYVTTLPNGGYSSSFSASTSGLNGIVEGGLVRNIVAYGTVVIFLSVCDNPSVFTLPPRRRG